MSKRYKGSKLDNWGTPKQLFDFYNIWRVYDLDLAAQPHNAKCSDFCSLETGRDGLKEDIRRRKVWCNPPFGDIAPWVEKAITGGAEMCDLLLPARTGMRWFKDCLRYGMVDFLRGRLTFEPPPGYVGEVTSAPFDCMVVHFGLWLDEGGLRGTAHQVDVPKMEMMRVAA